MLIYKASLVRLSMVWCEPITIVSYQVFKCINKLRLINTGQLVLLVITLSTWSMTIVHIVHDGDKYKC